MTYEPACKRLQSLSENSRVQRGGGERGDGPGHPRQGASKERNYKNVNAVTR